MTAWSDERILTMRPGERVDIASYAITLDGFDAGNSALSTAPVALVGPNYQATVVHFSVRSGGTLEAVMEPSKRAFAVRGTVTTESALATFWPSQLYLSLGDIGEDGATTVRVYWKPLVTLIWLGAVVMAIGGVFSLSDRRLRVGAPRPARPAVPVPAE